MQTGPCRHKSVNKQKGSTSKRTTINTFEKWNAAETNSNSGDSTFQTWTGEACKQLEPM
jgi:hypothetical protein